MTDSHRIRILAIDDHPLVREGIGMIIRQQPDMELVSQADTATEGLLQYRALKPDVTLMDLRLPDMSGIDALIALRTEFVNARVVILSMFHGDFEVQRALAAGARGFLLKTMPPIAIVESLRQVHAGSKCIPAELATQLADYIGTEPPTERELQILRAIAGGGTNRDVADALGISESTVKFHVSNVMQKLGANDRTETIMIALRRGIIQL